MPRSEARLINLSRIPREKRKEAWERLQRKYPAQAAICQDPLVIELRRQFGGELLIELPLEET